MASGAGFLLAVASLDLLVQFGDEVLTRAATRLAQRVPP
jgi:hypothetical protein